MDWLQDAINNIRKSYDLRGFYNQHKTLILSDEEYYGGLLNKANSMFVIDPFSANVDNTIIENFIFDLESDKEVFDLPKPESDSTDLVELVSPDTTVHHEFFGRPSSTVKIEILNPECDNLYEEVTKEIFRMAVNKCITNQKIADMLGLSIRTVRNKRRDYERSY